MNIDELYNKLVKAGETWSDLDAAATLLEETKKVILADLKRIIVTEYSGTLSDAAATTIALQGKKYKDHIKLMVQARQEANRAKVQYYGMQTYVELYRTEQSTRRAEMEFS